MFRVSIAVAVVVALCACGKRADPGGAQAAGAASSAEAAKPASPAGSTPGSVPRQAWSAALATVINETDAVQDKEGVTSFGACLLPSCPLPMRGTRDAFRSLRHYRIGSKGAVSLQPNVTTYIALRDCSLPTVFLDVSMTRRGDWLFMEKLGALVDGELALEVDLPSVTRDNTSNWVMEYAHRPLLQADIAGARKVAAAAAPIIRLTGSKGYVTLDAHATADARDGLAATLVVYDKLRAALLPVAGERCQP